MEIGNFETADTALRILDGSALPENVSNVILVGHLPRLQRECAADARLQSLLGASEADLGLLQAVLDGMTSKRDGASTRELYLVPPESSRATRRVCVVALPTACSRHNSPARPHAITPAVKANAGPGEIAVYCYLEDPSHALATGCAVARAFPTWVAQTAAARRLQAKLINIAFSDPELDPTALRVLRATAPAVRLAARLVDVPCNVLHTTEFVRQAQAVVTKLQEGLEDGGGEVSMEVIEGEALAEAGLGGLYGVGKAAVNPPALAVLKFFPPGTSAGEPATVWVGKGIVYDTGGLSIKTKAGMPGMKKDMGGAGGLLGAFRAAVEARVPQKPLYCLLCLAENAVGPLATRPDDTHLFYSGLTVEINNTDAEGRLVLADGVAYAARNLNPHVIINMCTLTGAQGVATGRNHAALYCNDEALEQSAVAAGRTCGDLAHAMPYCPEFYRGEFTSRVADMKNSVADRSNAQVSCAAQFIGNHLKEYQDEGRWLHIDMASPASSGQRATGYGVALLVQLLLDNEW